MNAACELAPLGEIGQRISEILAVLVGEHAQVRRQSVGFNEFTQHRFRERNGRFQVINCLENGTRFGFSVLGFVATESGFGLSKVKADHLDAAPNVFLILVWELEQIVFVVGHAKHYTRQFEAISLTIRLFNLAHSWPGCLLRSA